MRKTRSRAAWPRPASPTRWPRAVLAAGLLAAVAATTTGFDANRPPPVQAVPDLAAACRPEAMQAVASKLATGVTAKEIPNGPKFAGGVSFVPAAKDLPAYCQATGSFVTNPKTGKTANFLAT